MTLGDLEREDFLLLKKDEALHFTGTFSDLLQRTDGTTLPTLHPRVLSFPSSHTRGSYIFPPPTPLEQSLSPFLEPSPEPHGSALPPVLPPIEPLSPLHILAPSSSASTGARSVRSTSRRRYASPLHREPDSGSLRLGTEGDNQTSESRAASVIALSNA